MNEWNSTVQIQLCLKINEIKLIELLLEQVIY